MEQNFDFSLSEHLISELESWYTDKEYFPKEMSFQLFKNWFDYTYIDMCFDTLEDEIHKNE